MPTDKHDERTASAEGFFSTGQSDLAAMPDSELAQWQSGWKPGTEKHILAEKEWVRRLTARQLQEQYKYEERLARANRWWSIGAAALGIIGTLAGAWLGARLDGAKPIEGSQSSSPAPAVANSLVAPPPAVASAVSASSVAK